MKSRYSSRVLAVFLVTALAVASPAHAFRFLQNFNTGRVGDSPNVACTDPNGFTHWDIRAIDWFLNPQNKGAGMEQALADAMMSWWLVPDADHELWWRGHTNAGFATDGQNVFIWDSNDTCTGRCIATTFLELRTGQVIVEADIQFNNDKPWGTGPGDRDPQTIATHELGHTLGIGHTEVTSSPKPTMSDTYFGPDGRSLETDDRAALQCSESRYCKSFKLKGSGFRFGGVRVADITWNYLCMNVASVDVFRDGVKITTTPNDGVHRDVVGQGTAYVNYKVCKAGTTSCTNLLAVAFPPLVPSGQ